MSLLATQFREKMLKDKDIDMQREAQTYVGYPTGFPVLDFTNGQIVHVKNTEKGMDFNYFSVGITNGSFNSVIGRSQSGKTTGMWQFAWNMIAPFENASIFADNTEAGIDWPRISNVVGVPEETLKERIISRDRGITAENFYRRIKEIHDMKLENPEKYQYDTGKLDNFGNPIIEFEPTIYIIDSIAMLMPEKYASEEELSGQMSTTAAAKVVTQILRTIIPMIKSANIIVFAVNHIMQQINANPMMHKRSQLPFLSPDERLPRGDTLVLLSNTIMRFVDNKKLKEDEKYKIAGAMVDVYFEKTRSSRPHQAVTMVFDYVTGFDPLLSTFVFMKEKTNRIKGSGVGMYVDDFTDVKFSMGNFKDKYLSNEEFRMRFDKAVSEELVKIPKASNADFAKEKKIMSNLYDLCMNQVPSVENNAEEI
jgi:RecA/RadA recombinase